MVSLRAGLIAFASLTGLTVLLAACTEPTPGYCNPPLHECPATQMCRIEIHTCVPGTGDAGSDAAASDAPDAPAGSDLATGGRTGAGGSASDGGDAGDAAADMRIGCGKNDDCAGDGGAPVCEKSSGKCVGCLVSATDCKGTEPVCDPSTKTCVACLASSDCTDKTAPVCDGKVCRGCRADSECASVAPGVCMSHEDGRCATDAETIYVQNNVATCSDNAQTGGGTSATPFCTSQLALNAVTPARHLVVLRGPDPLTEWSFSANSAKLTVVGQSGATISPGARIGVHVGAGVVTIRDLRVTGGTAQPGVVADGTAELHMDRCLVDSNKGGILVTGGGFDIVNTVVARNKSSATAGCGTWAGVCISLASTPSVARLLNDTVVFNEGPGIACASSDTAIAGSILYNNTAGDVSLCDLTPCCAGDPMLTTDYHLTAASTACIDKLDPSPLVPDDVDGRPRRDAKSDCGADEYGN